jgi:hypothetical protein
VSGVSVVFANAERMAAMREKALRDEALTVRCADCEWTFEGRADVAMRRHRDHRVKQHGRPESSDVRWHDEPPRRGEKAVPKSEAEPKPPTLRDRAVARLCERGESTAAEVAADIGERQGSVAGALDWARRAGLVQVRKAHRGTAKLWRLTGTEPTPDPERVSARSTLPLRDRVVAALRESARPMTIKELAEATGGPDGHITNAVAAARRSGVQVERVGRGVYRLKTPG